MNIVVCIKQVPASQEGDMDPKTGVLIRSGETKLNPFDNFALETGIRLREQFGGTVTAVTMGPESSVSVLRDAFALGVDECVLLNDKAFAGADVLATTHALAQGIKTLGKVDIILCGRQTVDGDTAQVGPALAGQLGLPVASWVQQITYADLSKISIVQSLSDGLCESELNYPCLLCIDQDAVKPRLPSLKLKLAAKKKSITILTLNDLDDKEYSHYGLEGSPTRVKKIFSPEQKTIGNILQGEPSYLAKELAEQIENCLGR